MKGRIKHGDLDHLLRLVQAGLPERASAHRDGASGDGASFDRSSVSGASDAGASRDWLSGDDPKFAASGNEPPDHAFWNANHAYWAEKLKGDTGDTWTQTQYASAASIINAAEYQHVVFCDIAGALRRGLAGSGVGNAQAHADLDQPSMARFASGVYRSIQSEFEETIDLVDATTGRAHQVRIASVLEDVRRFEWAGGHHQGGGDQMLSPDDAEPGTNPRTAPDIALSPRELDLGELTGGRTRNGNSVPFNDVRGELFAQSGLAILLPYLDWDDFRDRNHLSDELIAELKAAYPEGFNSVDLWVGGLAERPAVGALGPTIAATLSTEIAQMNTAGAQYHLDLLAGTQLAAEISTQSWSDIVARNMGALSFADYFEGGPEHVLGAGLHTASLDAGNDDEILIGSDGNDLLHGGAGDDFLDGGTGADVLIGGSGNDTYVVDNVMDRVIETPDGGDADTILTTLAAFSLGDDPDDTVAGDAVHAPTETIAPAAAASVAAAVDAAPVEDTSADDAFVDEASADDASLDDAPGGLLDEGDGAPPTEVPAAPDDVVQDPPAAPEGTGVGHADNVENLTYIGDSDFEGWGNAANNILIGGAENDVLWGRGGDDVLIGGDGNDVLFGGSGDDFLMGGSGSDRFDGGSGNDVLYLASGDGGPGHHHGWYDHDTIILQPGFGDDVVVGFDAGRCGAGPDRLDVSAYTSLNADSIGAEIQIISNGPHTVITINDDSITLLDVNAGSIGKDDFIFG
jgi:Ca2+-binding RTX toxin-like protein